MSTNINASLNIEVPDQDIEDLIDAGGYGIGYWCARAEIDEEKKTYTISPDAEAIDGGFKPTYKLTYAKLAEVLVDIAIGKYEVGFPRKYAQEWLVATIAGEGDGGYLDSDIADVVIQIACFGEVVFG
jgi:hypothetical protein